MNKKAISGVITAVIMIAIVMSMISVLWVVVNNIVEDKLTEAGSCFNTFEKVKINNFYTCYNTPDESSGDPDELHLSIDVSEIDIEKLLVSVSGSGESKSFTLTKDGINENFLRNYKNGIYGELITLPEKNSGKTYIINTGFFPISIQIAPIINGKQCEVSDSLYQIDNCKSLVSP